MGLPIRLILVAAGAAGAVVAAKRRRSRRNSKSKENKQTRHQNRPDIAVHAYSASPPPEAALQAGAEAETPTYAVQQHQQSRLGYVAMFALASLLIMSTAAVLVVREQWDLAAAVMVAFVLSLLATAVRRRQRAAAEAAAAAAALEAADATVEVADELPAKELPDFNGTWIKDGSLSDSLDPAMRLIHMNGMVRTAARLIKGVKLQLDTDQQRFHFGVFSVISWFKIYEHYSLTGEVSEHRRRDFRRGKARGVARPTPRGTLLLEYEWGEPHGGRGVDEFSLDEEGRLVIAATITAAAGGSESYRQVYNRKHS